MDFLNSQGEQDASVGQWVGEGVYGNVFVVRQNNGQSYSKKVFLPQFSSSMHHERRFLEQLHHPNIVTLYGHDEEPSCTLYLEVLEKTVGQAYCEEGCDHTRLLKNTLLHISHALLHLADHRIVHMDIKKDNVMLSTGGSCSSISVAWHLDSDRKIESVLGEGRSPVRRLRQSPEVLEILVRDYQHLKEPIKGKLPVLHRQPRRLLPRRHDPRTRVRPISQRKLERVPNLAKKIQRHHDESLLFEGPIGKR